jgi:hypothetical protein
MTGMAHAKELTVRTWSATASSAGAENYSRYFTGTLLPELDYDRTATHRRLVADARG